MLAWFKCTSNEYKQYSRFSITQDDPVLWTLELCARRTQRRSGTRQHRPFFGLLQSSERESAAAWYHGTWYHTRTIVVVAKGLAQRDTDRSPGYCMYSVPVYTIMYYSVPVHCTNHVVPGTCTVVVYECHEYYSIW